MRKIVRIILIPLLLAAAPGCKWVSEMIHNEPIAAKAGSHELTREELRKAIPDGLSPEDSAAFALQYINTWARDLLYLDRAEEALSAEEKDVSRELEELRRSLLKVRYEQKYIAARLDSLITPAEMEQYYAANQEKFLLPDGTPAPLEDCAKRIEDLILSARKHALSLELEESLLRDARENHTFIIYEDD